MKKNVGSQLIGVQMITIADGTDFTTAITCEVTIDGGTKTASGGTGPTHEGEGFFTYIPTQAETNGDHLAFTFAASGAISATVQVYTTFPQTVDNDVLASGASGFAATNTVVDTINTNVGTAGAGLTNLGASGNDWNTVVPLTAAGTRTAVGLASAHMDTQFTASATATGFSTHAATDIVSAGAITTLTGAVVNVDLVDTLTTYTGNTLQTADVASGVTLAAGAITNASLAGNMEIVFETDFATNYNITRNAWVTNGTDFIGTGWNVAKTGYALTTADWNVGKTGYSLTATTGLGAQTANITGNLSGSVGSVTGAAGSVTGAVGSVAGNVDGNVTGSVGSNLELGPTEVAAELATYDGPTNTEMEARTPTAAQLAYIVANAGTGYPVVFTTSGGSTTAAVINTIDGSAGSAVNDQYNGRLLAFTDGTLKGVVTDITDYVGSTTTMTITAIPAAPTASHNARLI